jgi:hypothetical protein
MVVFVALLSRGFTSLDQTTFSSNFYDLQARAFLHGHMWVPTGSASIEGIVLRGRTYIYFGPFLALLRAPIIWVAPGATGHLAQASMVIAAITLVAGASWLAWNVRHAVLGSVPVGRPELIAQAVFSAALAGGSVVLYLAGSASVYFETELWGCALAVVALAAFLSYWRYPSRRAAALLSLSVLCGALTRLSIALGPVLLLIVTLGIAGWRAYRVRRVGGGADDRGSVWILSLGTLATLVLPQWFNWARFGSLTSVPWSHQVISMADPAVGAFYRHHGPISLTNLPSTLAWYLRPTALLTTGLFPFFSFTTHADVLNRSGFLAVGRSSSLPASMPLLSVLALIGFVIIVLGRRAATGMSATDTRALRWALVGALSSGITVLVFDTIANRYLADLLPLVALPALVAISWVAGHWTLWPGSARVITGVVAVVLLLVSTLANLSFGLQESFVFASSSGSNQRAGLLGWQLALHQALPIGLPFPVSSGMAPPSGAVPDQLLVQPGCAGVYQYNPPIWNSLEVGAAGGRRVLTIQVPRVSQTVEQPLLVAGASADPASVQSFSIEYGPSAMYRILFRSGSPDRLNGGDSPPASPWERLPGSRDLRIVLTIAGSAPSGGRVEEALVPGVLDFTPEVAVAPADVWTVGRFPEGGTAFTGRLTMQPVDTPLCQRIQEASRGS